MPQTNYAPLGSYTRVEIRATKNKLISRPNQPGDAQQVMLANIANLDHSSTDVLSRLASGWSLEKIPGTLCSDTKRASSTAS